MKVGELNPAPAERIRFNGWRQHTVSPLSPGCYVIASVDGDILYIGQSTRIGDRMKSHLIDPRKRQCTPNGVAYWLYHCVCKSEGELNALERGWVLQYKVCEGGEMPPTGSGGGGGDLPPPRTFPARPGAIFARFAGRVRPRRRPTRRSRSGQRKGGRRGGEEASPICPNSANFGGRRS